jgi:hypothetical protein
LASLIRVYMMPIYLGSRGDCAYDFWSDPLPTRS